MSTTASTIQGRMLCAAGLAYALPHSTSTLTVQKMTSDELSEPFYSGVGYTAVPTSIQKGLAGCTVGYNGDGIVVAFRGTEFDSAFNWLDDTAMLYHSLPGHQGKIHSGFYHYVNDILDGLVAEVKKLQAAKPNAPILMTGHSAGAGMAPIAAYLLSTVKDITTSALYLMAPPSPGDTDFARTYNALFPTSYSYANAVDIVPMLPFSRLVATSLLPQTQNGVLKKVLESMIFLDYQRVGTDDNIFLLNFPSKGDSSAMSLLENGVQWGLVEAVLVSDKLLKETVNPQGSKWWETLLGFFVFAEAHSHTCGHGYMGALCPEVCTGS